MYPFVNTFASHRTKVRNSLACPLYLLYTRTPPPFDVFVKISYAKGWFSPATESWLLNCSVVVELTKNKN